MEFICIAKLIPRRVWLMLESVTGDRICDETRDSVTELIMTGRGHRVSALMSCPDKIRDKISTILIILV